jgi:dTDP-4-dehydrorhamnose 3,5-epimerase
VRVTPVDIPGVLLIEPSILRDPRGCFVETHHERRYRKVGIAGRFVQDNSSRSGRHTLRGVHFQEPHAQGKLVMALEGVVYDVIIVDLRRSSPRFGRWYSIELSGDNLRQVYVPPGRAHGFCVLSETASFLYKCTEYYSPNDERGIVWNDPALGIPWPVKTTILSAKDRSYGTLRTMDAELPAYRADQP